jgi:hypothetical protein
MKDEETTPTPNKLPKGSTVDKQGRIKLAKGKGGRPQNSGLILQVVEPSIIGHIVPLKVYKEIEDIALQFHSAFGYSAGQAAADMHEILLRHMSSGGIIESYKPMYTTTTDLRKYRILEIIHLPSVFGCMSIVPGYTLETKIGGLLSGKPRLISTNMYPNSKAFEHKNPDRREYG